MRLATATDVMTRINRNVSNVASIESALDAVTLLVETHLGTPLGEATRVDYYSPNFGFYHNALLHEYNLTQGFLQGTAEVFYAGDSTPLGDLTGLTTIAEYSETYEDKGKVIVMRRPVSGPSSVAIRYTAGFAVDANDIIQSAPAWLTNAGIAAATYLIHTQTGIHNKKDVLDMSPELRRIMNMHLNPYIRPRASGMFPSRSVIPA